MKPLRHLAVPDCPSFVVKVETNSGKCEQLPEMRLERLFATERFRRFLRARRSDGTWRWVKPEVGENDELTRGSILESCVALAPKSERDVRRFNEALEAAREEQSGEKAFEFYEQYKAQKLVVDGEDVAKKFLDIAVAKNFQKALDSDKLRRFDSKRLSDQRSNGVFAQLKKKGIESPYKVVSYINRARCFGITIARCQPWCELETYEVVGAWKQRSLAGQELMKMTFSVDSIFSTRLMSELKAIDAQMSQEVEKRYNAIVAVWKVFEQICIEDLTEQDVLMLTAFFLSGLPNSNPPYKKDVLRDAKIIGEICRQVIEANE